jgi:hypothetical protein
MFIIGGLSPPAFYFAHWNLPKLTFNGFFCKSDHAKFEPRSFFEGRRPVDGQSRICDYALI